MKVFSQFDSADAGRGKGRFRERRTRAMSRHIRVTATSRKRGPARIMSEAQLRQVLAYISRKSAVPAADRLKILFSFFAGLRVSEIARLQLSDVLNSEGKIGIEIVVPKSISKSGRTRKVPIHPELRAAIEAFRVAFPGMGHFAISGRYSKIRVQSVPAMTSWFLYTYKKAGLSGCSSHSGRRSFVTSLARVANRYGNSLRDVQLLAGHARLDTTERYIEPSDDVRNLVNSLGAMRASPEQEEGK